MYYSRTTQVPNQLFDYLLPRLTFSELKVLLVVIRQTLGWVIGPSGQRKSRDWLSSRRMETLSGLSKRAISMATSSLIERGLLVVTNHQGALLESPSSRKGRTRLYYSTTFPQVGTTPEKRSAFCAEKDRQSMPPTKPIGTKPSWRSQKIRPHYCGPIGPALEHGLPKNLLLRILDEPVDREQQEGWYTDHI